MVFGALQKSANLVDLEKLLQNEYLTAKFGFDTAENEPRQVCGTSRAREGSLGSLTSLVLAENQLR